MKSQIGSSPAAVYHLRMEPQIEALQENGYVVVPRLVPQGALNQLNETARAQLLARADPLELEADLRYPGAPSPAPTPEAGRCEGSWTYMLEIGYSPNGPHRPACAIGWKAISGREF